MKTCCVSDDLSGDMLAPSWPNLVFLTFHVQDQVYHNKHQFLDILWRIACYSSGNQGASKQGASVTMEKDKHQSDELIPSPHISRVLALGLIELVTPDVIYNAIPWPEEEFLKVTIERSVRVIVISSGKSFMFMLLPPYILTCVWDTSQMLSQISLRLSTP